VRGLEDGKVEDIDKDQHIAGIQQALKEIEAGTFEKVVLSRSEFWHTSRSPEALFRSKCVWPILMHLSICFPIRMQGFG